MLQLPLAIKKILHQIKCPNCQSSLKPNYVTAEGIRNSVVQKDKTAFFIEYACPNCQQYSTLELILMTVEDFVMEMIDQFAQDEENDTQEQKYSVRQVSKISNNEYKDAIKMIRSCDNNLDFLRQIGMTPEEINKHAFYKKKGQ